PREFVVLSNVDIHFQPFVYRALAALIGQGYDVITTNRRTIDASAEPEHFWPLMMAERGSDHPGFDCFVFPVSLFERFAPSYCCCGASHAMRSLLFNLVAHATRFLMLTTAQLSFHVGDDRYWSDPAFEDYTSFNYDQAKQAILSLSKEPSVAARLYDFIVAQEGWPYNELLPALASRADQ
ncbi:MAG TPA: hypothetical protein VKT78_00225, partial [Fimbriimonadaceae bacterium]|nr:hypothetical protein [Fimbriimonadaceae bacterium]